MSITTELGDQHEARLTGGTVRYRERGGGEPIVFVHGILVNGDLWSRVAPPLAERHRCITPDWPFGGHELPMDEDADLSPHGVARLIAEFLEQLDLRDATIVANDTGGAFAQMLVTEHPDRVGRLVLTSCDAFRNFPPHSIKPLQPLGYVPGGGAVLAASLKPRVAQRGLAKSLAKNEIPPHVIGSALDAALRIPGSRRDALKIFRAARPKQTMRAAERLPGFDKPALVAWSADDLFFPAKHGRRLADLLPQGRFELLENARTFSPIDRPERLVELIDELVAPGEGASRSAEKGGAAA